MQSEKFTLQWLLNKITASWTLLVLASITVIALFLRCLHLFNSHNYYVLSADSHFFQWLAQRVMSGLGPPQDAPPGAIYSLHSGLAYPLAYVARAISYVFGPSSADALTLVCKLLPPILGVISLVIIYLVAARIWNRRVALFSALAWAIILPAVLVGAAGYLDRDGLSSLIIAVGAMLFYFSKGWKCLIFSRDIGWLLAGLGVLGLEGLLYVEWMFVGPVLLIAILAVYFVVNMLVAYFELMKKGTDTDGKFASTLERSNWKTFVVVVAGNIIVAAFCHSDVASWLNTVTGMISPSGESGVAELQGITLVGLLEYHLFWVPIALGIYLAWKKRSRGAILLACWFLCLLAASLFAGRVLLYAAPAVCLLCGVGMDFLWEWKGRGQQQTFKKAGVVALLCLLVMVSLVMVPSLGSSHIMAVDEDWQDALTYLRENTPQDSVIMSQWSWGYWILDLGQRRPVVDNGYYNYDSDRLRDVGLAYSTTEPSEAVKIMEKYNADYLIFSKLDFEYAGTIMGWAGLDENADAFPEDSLIARTLSGKFESGGGLEVVYRSVPQGEVVILGLTN